MMSSISVTSCFPPFYGINPLPLFLEIFIILCSCSDIAVVLIFSMHDTDDSHVSHLHFLYCYHSVLYIKI